jgi:hypothetical protein
MADTAYCKYNIETQALSRLEFPMFQISKFELDDQGHVLQILG